MELNMLNDLAKAMKALDGKKKHRCRFSVSGNHGNLTLIGIEYAAVLGSDATATRWL